MSSLDHRPPFSPATTRRARPPCPSSSGYVVSFLRRASARAVPSLDAAPLLGVPSWRTGETNVVSMASCALPEKRKPISLRASKRSNPTQVKIPDEDVHHHSRTRFAADAGGSTLHCEATTSQLKQHTPTYDGQKDPEGGHIGRRELSSGEGGGRRHSNRVRNREGFHASQPARGQAHKGLRGQWASF